MTSIEGGVFQYCSSLTSVSIPDGVTNIKYDAFKYCFRLARVDIPDSVTNIERMVFAGCNALADVYYGGAEEEWNAITIGRDNECLTNATIHFAKLGDTNDNGEVDVRDIITLRRYVAGGYDITVNEDALDTNGDGEVDVRDIVVLRRFIAGGYDIELK